MTDRYIDDVRADLKVVKMLLNDGRPLQALATLNDAIERLDEEVDDA